MARLTLRERIFGRAEDRTLTSQTIPATMLTTAPGEVTPEKSLQIADAYACIRALSDAAASLPLIPYRRTESGRERIESGRIVELLNRPSAGMTQANLIGQLVAHLNTHGNAYLGKFRDGEEVVQLAALIPDRVRPEIVNDRILFEVTGPKGERTVCTERDIVHIKGMTTNGLTGLSPVRQARIALGLSDQLTKHASTFFENEATPRGLLKLQKFAADQTDLDALRTAWETEHKGNPHRIAVIGGEADFQAISMNLDDAQFLEQRRLSSVEVARIFRVPGWIVGAPPPEGSLTYSNVESQALDFLRYSVRPWLIVIEQAISNDRDLMRERQFVEFLLDALLRADSRTRAEIYTRALDPVTGWMTRDEVRTRENLPTEGVPGPAPTNGRGDPDWVDVF